MVNCETGQGPGQIVLAHGEEYKTPDETQIVKGDGNGGLNITGPTGYDGHHTTINILPIVGGGVSTIAEVILGSDVIGPDGKVERVEVIIKSG